MLFSLVDGQICKIDMRKGTEENLDVIDISYIKGLSHLHEAKCIDAKGSILASGGYESLIKLYDCSTQSVVKTLEHHNNKVLDLKWSPFLPMLATTSTDKTIQILF